MEGATNFRDFGGYKTVDGRRVKWGCLYRSDQLSALTDVDLVTLSGLGLRVVYDLREDEERRRRPSRLGDGLPRVVELALPNPADDSREFETRILSGNIDNIDFRQEMIRQYQCFVTEPRYNQQFMTLLKDLAQPASELPVLIHCAGGKDRTGFAAAVILLTLGVAKECVMRDYLLSNTCRLKELESSFETIRKCREERGVHTANLGSIWFALRAEPDYLEAAIQMASSMYVSFQAYLRSGLCLSDEEQDRLRHALLE